MRVYRICEYSESFHFPPGGGESETYLSTSAQGAAQAIEDAGVLSALFAKITHPSQLPRVLKLYEKLRKPRTSRIVQASFDQGVAYMLPDGLEQRERDRKLAVKGAKQLPIRSIDPAFQAWMLGHDCVAEAERAWEEGDG